MSEYLVETLIHINTQWYFCDDNRKSVQERVRSVKSTSNSSVTQETTQILAISVRGLKGKSEVRETILS